MTCRHSSGYRCYSCSPELWDTPDATPEEILTFETGRKVRTLLRYLKAKRAYYAPDHGEVQPVDVMSDWDFDKLENSIKVAYPDHPCLGLVGWDDSYMGLAEK